MSNLAVVDLWPTPSHQPCLHTSDSLTSQLLVYDGVKAPPYNGGDPLPLMNVNGVIQTGFLKYRKPSPSQPARQPFT